MLREGALSMSRNTPRASACLRRRCDCRITRPRVSFSLFLQLATPPLVLSNVRCSEVPSAALNVPSMALVPSIGHRGCSTHPRTPFPPTPVPAGHPFGPQKVGMQTALGTSGDAPGGSVAARGTQCCRSVTEGARSTPRPSFDPPCSRSAIRSDRARSESDDASWRRSTGSAGSASESRVE